MLDSSKLELQVLAQLITWGLGSELWSSLPHTQNSEPLPWGLTMWLRLDLNLGSSHLRLPSAGIPACANLPDLLLGVRGMAINRVSTVTNFLFQVLYFEKLV